MSGWQVDFSDDDAVAQNIVWARRHVVPWLLLVAAAALVVAAFIGGPVCALALLVFAVASYGVVSPGPAGARLLAAAGAAVALWVALAVAR